jgi:hypothetical protein
MSSFDTGIRVEGKGMLCPECKVHAAGGEPCPRCGKPVPERETFGGQGEHYFRVLVLLSVGVLVLFVLLAGLGAGFGNVLQRFFASRWTWLYVLLFIIPIGIGGYTWNTLRNEEVTVTDTFILKYSRWGTEQFAWAQVKAFHRIPILRKYSWLRQLASVRRLLSRERLVWHLSPQAYELVGYEDAQGEAKVIRLEPGTIDDLPWLLQLIQEHLGPPTEE